MTTAFINRIATAVPQHDVHQAFIDFATGMLPEGTMRNLFRRMARLSAIEHRYSFVQPVSHRGREMEGCRSRCMSRGVFRSRRGA